MCMFRQNCTSTRDGVESLQIQATECSHGDAGIQRLVVIFESQLFNITRLLFNLF